MLILHYEKVRSLRFEHLPERSAFQFGSEMKPTLHTLAPMHYQKPKFSSRNLAQTSVPQPSPYHCDVFQWATTLSRNK
ncbi:MAG: hypothetical protein LH649_03245 [Pseudanabaena sp. CAN_BIN31]|nr:hypothetical protein [Pseudanabaena sp. CAN_BIN31]